MALLSVLFANRMASKVSNFLCHTDILFDIIKRLAINFVHNYIVYNKQGDGKHMYLQV